MSEGLIYESLSRDVYWNLAIERYLLFMCEKKQIPILYFWQNEKAVVIGRNQNAYTECNIAYAQLKGIQIARRLSGGGAVYHDTGNVNYTMIFPKNMYNVDISTEVIINALNKLGIRAKIYGRNDICIDDKKISGNAFYSNESVGMHHGTLIYKLDSRTLENVLMVSSKKLSKHGISSVKSRVCDIATDYPNITIKNLLDSVKDIFCKRYKVERIDAPNIAEEKIYCYYDEFKSYKWIFEKVRDYEVVDEEMFVDGIIKLSLQFSGERIENVEISTDFMDTGYIEQFREECNKYIKENKITKIEDLDYLFERMNVHTNFIYTMKRMFLRLFEKRFR